LELHLPSIYLSCCRDPRRWYFCGRWPIQRHPVLRLGVKVFDYQGP